MTDEKTNEFAFDGGSKESFRERLKMLIGERSIRGAARCWGLSFSTLNNYLNKGTEPSFTAIRSIAYKEQISLDWLAFGSDDELSNNLKTRSGKTGIDGNNGKLMTAWLMVLDSIDAQEAQAILRIIHRKGIEGIISACMKANDTNENNITNNVERALLELPIEEQERLMALHEAKKGAAPGERAVENAETLDSKNSGAA